MSTVIDSIEQRQKRRVPRFDAGDRVRVHFQVIEGSRKRTQVFEGVVMKRQGNGLRETFTVRKQSFGVGVERTFPLHSPKIETLEVAARGDVRRAKLYYLRDRVGKAARVAERRWGIEEDVLGAEEEHPVDAEGTSLEEIDEQTAAEEPAAEETAAEEPAATEPSEPVGEQSQAPTDVRAQQSADEADEGEEPTAAEEEARG